MVHSRWVEVYGPSFTTLVDMVGRDVAKATSQAIAASSRGATIDLRRQLTAAGYASGFGNMPNAIQAAIYPKPPAYSPRAAGSITVHGTAAERIFVAFAEGPLITPKGHRALAIPLHEFRGGGSQNLLIGAKSAFFGRNQLIFVPLRNHAGKGIGLLCSKPDAFFKLGSRRRGDRAGFARKETRKLIPQFLLISAAQMPVLLKPDEVLSKWADMMPAYVEQALAQLEQQ